MAAPPLPSRPGGPDPRGPPPPFTPNPPAAGGLPPSLPSRGGPPVSPRAPPIAPRDAAPPPAPARDAGGFGGPPPAPARDAAPPPAFGGPPPPAPRDAAPPPPMDVAPPPPSPGTSRAAAPAAPPPSPNRPESSPQRDNSGGDIGGPAAANKTSLGVQMKAINRDTSASKSQPPPSAKKKKGLFGGLFGKKQNQSTQPQCAGPTNFSHDVHATWDPVNGFQIDNLPAAWKELFKRSGVKKADLRDPKTSLFILETIAANLTPDPAAEPEPSPSSSDKGKKGKESKESKPAANIPAPPPPPPPPSNAPAPPPPPPGGKPGGAAAGPKLSLAEQLQAKQEAGLRSAEESIEASGCLPAVENSRHMEQVLRNAMKGRRTAVEEEDDADDWSDEE